MDTIHFLAIGLSHVFTIEDLAMLVLGLVIGMAVSIMPGLGLVMAIVLALPFTYRMQIEPSIILLTAIYVSGTYAGCFTAILYRIPGEPMDVPLLWDGYRMAENGQPAKALGWALLGALVGGLVSSAVMVALAVPLSNIALSFGPADYFAAVLFGLTTVTALGSESLTNALVSLCAGLLVSVVGVDPIYGASRFTFGSPILMNGIPYVVLLVGVYGLAEIFMRLGSVSRTDQLPHQKQKIVTAFPSLREIWEIRSTFVRSSVLGTFLGIVPGAGATITSFVSYATEKQYGKRGDRLGDGLPEGIVAPQIGSTASVAGHMIPLLTLGIPGSAATAVILAAFLLHGVQPGSFLFTSIASKTVVYTIFASMFVGVIGMCVIGFYWIRVVIKVLAIPSGILSGIVIMFCIIGAYAKRNSLSDVWMLVIFGIVGYVFEKCRFPTSPMVLGAILGPLAERSFMQTMIGNDNDWRVLFEHRISGTLMVASILVVIYSQIRSYLKARSMPIVMHEGRPSG